VGAALVIPAKSATDDAVGKRSAAERKRLHEETVAAVDRIAAEAHAKLPRSMAQSIGAIYARFSTLFQDSAVDQIRELYDFAVANKIFVPREYVFFDLGVRGCKNQREGLDQLRSILAAKKVQVLLLFATNRLARKVYLTLQFVDQTAVENGIRCVFVKDGIDTAKEDEWHSLLHLRAMMDEYQVRVNADHIRAALKGMFLEGLVRGTLHLGYTGEPIPGKLTKRGRHRQRIVIDPEQAKIVSQVFEWYVGARLSHRGIARKLNAMPDVPKPRNSDRWTANSVRALLMRETYRGLWKFGVTERRFLMSKDYTRQIPRDAPLEETTFEYLRIVPDSVWFAAQERLAKNRPVRGRRSKNEDADPSLRILSGLFWCPEHNRRLRTCSAYGNYWGCPSCAMLEAEERFLFSKPHRAVVQSLLCDKLAELIRQDAELVDRVIAECRTQAAGIQRPDASEAERLEKAIASLSRKVEFNIRNPGETDQDEQEIAETLRCLRRERKGLQDQLGRIKSAATEQVRVPSEEEVRSLLDRLSDILQRAAAGQLDDDQDAARDIVEMLTGGRIEMYQQGERKEMKGWLQGRFTVRILEVLVERFTGGKPAKAGDGVDVVIDFKRPRQNDIDADTAIRLWLDGRLSKDIAAQLECGPSYVSRLLRIGAEWMGTTLETLQSQRKSQPVDPRRLARYQTVADDAQKLWWDELYPTAVVARRLGCSTTTITAVLRYWHESRRLPVPTFEDWSRRLEERVVLLFDQNELEVQDIADRVHLGRTKVMEIVRESYRRLGKELPDGRTRRARLNQNAPSPSPSSM